MVGRRVGVEEELFLVDPATGILRPVSAGALQAHDDARQPQLEHELFLEQIETATVPCTGLAELDAELRRGRRSAAANAEAAGAAIAAVAAVAVGSDAAMTPKGRYQSMAEHHGVLTRENLVCGMHVHVEVGDDQEAVTALDRIRPWLQVLLAISANSPFWRGEDSGYASYRAQVIDRWPSSGPTEPFGTATAYHTAIEQLISTTAALDEAMIYFDARLAANYPTLEIRVADVCTEVEDAVLIAGLARALVETAVREDSDGVPAPVWRVEMLRACRWAASRWGLARDLIHPVGRKPRPAFDVLADLVDHVGAALDRAGDREAVDTALAKLRIRGTGSVRQRAVYSRRARGEDVLIDAAERTRDTYSRT